MCSDGIPRCLSLLICEYPSKIRPKIPYAQLQRISERANLVWSDFPVTALDEAQVGSRDPHRLANLGARKPKSFNLRRDRFFCHVHAEFLHYVNFSRKRSFT